MEPSRRRVEQRGEQNIRRDLQMARKDGHSGAASAHHGAVSFGASAAPGDHLNSQQTPGQPRRGIGHGGQGDQADHRPPESVTHAAKCGTHRANAHDAQEGEGEQRGQHVV